MFGIDFIGHPDLRNMYLPTEFEGFPLRKDFPLLARMVKPWPGIVDVEPMPAEEAGCRRAGSARLRRRRSSEGEAAAHPETAAEPADVTDETVADAPAHPEFVSGKVPGTGDAADTNGRAGSASAQHADRAARDRTAEAGGRTVVTDVLSATPAARLHRRAGGRRPAQRRAGDRGDDPQHRARSTRRRTARCASSSASTASRSCGPSRRPATCTAATRSSPRCAPSRR